MYVGVVAAGREEVGEVQRWREVKEAKRWAADDTRPRVLADPLPARFVEDMVLRSCARALMYTDVWLARRLQAQSAAAAAEVYVGAEVQLRDAARFETRFVEARRAALGREANEARLAGRKGRGRGRVVQWLDALWAPRGRRLVLVGVSGAGWAETEEAAAHRSGAECLAAFRAHWRPVFERRPTQEESCARARAMAAAAW